MTTLTDIQAETPPTALDAKQDPRLERAIRFITAVKSLYPKQKGKLAVLRRNAGNSLAEARGITWFFELLNRYVHSQRPERLERDQEIYFLVAALLAFDRKALLGNPSIEGDFGRTMALYNQGSERSTGGVDAGKTSPVERRFHLLLDADFDIYNGGELPFRLRQNVRMVLAKSELNKSPINWPQLLLDLLDWQQSQKRVQKRWARSFYSPPSVQFDEGENSVEETPKD